MLAILLIPAALCYTFGEMVGDTRQGWAVLAAMTVIFVAAARRVRVGGAARQPAPRGARRRPDGERLQPGGNMEGKEVRFGIANSALWATATTAASNGSVNSMHDSFTPLGGLVPMWLMQLGEVIFGGVGSGLYGMLIFAIIAVFVAGLMVGRTPEYLGKKIEAYEMKMASLVILDPAARRAGRHRASRCVTPRRARRAVCNPGAHGFSEILYAFSLDGQQQRQRLRRPRARTRRSTTLRCGIAMLVARYWLADSDAGDRRLAGRARRSCRPAPARCRRTRRCSSCCWSASSIIVGALTFVPALALGPIVEHLHADRADQARDRCHGDHVKARPLFDPAIVRRAVVDVVPQARPAASRCATR